MHLSRLFAGRMFHGSGELGADDLDLGMGVVLIFLAMPGVLVSLLMFEKYGSLIRFLRALGTRCAVITDGDPRGPLSRTGANRVRVLAKAVSGDDVDPEEIGFFHGEHTLELDLRQG